ncbi:hypothetical protein GCM10020221_17270 [Streptomyces thioluteus]|uniref:Uncharacterized protein n=1 Tax=Streptomyces thioluteus TaxID=66431 RepID=A0ABP6J7L3_STRTU
MEVVWQCLPVREAPPADVPSLGEAERELAEALREATEVLTRLDVAGSGPAADAALEAYRARAESVTGGSGAGLSAARGARAGAGAAGGRTVAIASRSGDGGGREHGAAVSAAEITARAAALRPVERTARRAQVAAYNAPLEERERGRP